MGPIAPSLGSRPDARILFSLSPFNVHFEMHHEPHQHRAHIAAVDGACVGVAKPEAGRSSLRRAG